MAHEDTRTDIRADRGGSRVRLLLLRPAALPLDDLRRAGAAEAGGLPDQGPVQRGDAAGGGVRRPDLERLRGQGEVDRPGELRAEQGPRGRDARDRQPLRTDPGRYEGDAEAEDAARRDLRRAQPGQPRRTEAGGGRDLAEGAGGALGAAR